MTDEYHDDGDSGGPTSHRYLYDIPREELFTQFVVAVRAIRVDGGPLCLPAEAMALSRTARAVEARVDASDPREDKLGTVATVLRVLLSRADGLDKGEDQYYYEPVADLVRHFAELRAELRDWLPTPPVPAFDGVPADFIESLRDGPNPDGQPGLTFDACGRPWIEPDPADEVLPYDHPDVIAMAENDPALAEMIAEDQANPWPDGPGMAGEPPEPLQD